MRNYTKEERLIILEEVLNVNVRTDKDIKQLTNSSLNDIKRGVIRRLYERGIRRTEGALVVQISQCGCDIYKPTDEWSKKNYTDLI